MAEFETKLADMTHLNNVLALMGDSARELGEEHLVDPEHSRAHAEALLRRGTSILLLEQGAVIGAAMFTRIDAGYALLEHLETAHLYILRDRRSIRAVRALFEAIRAFADTHRLTLLLHQVSYAAALVGRKTDTERVETLYKYFKFDGPYGITYVCRPKQRKPG